MKKIIVPEKIKNQIITDYLNGNSVLSLSKKYGYKYDKTVTIIKNANITIRGNDIYSKKYTNDSYVFDKIDTEEKAYWLGFLYADGYVSNINSHKNFNVELGLQKQDKTHLEKFKAFLNTRNKIVYKEATQSFKITINNKQLHSDLIQKGCIPNKSNLIRFPDNNILPDDLIRHFVRGYIDGDGWIGMRMQKNNVIGRLGITSGSIEMLRDIIEKCKWQQMAIVKDKRSSSTYNVLWTNGQVIEMLDFLYKDSTIYLDRKYNKYKELKNAVLNQRLLEI